MITQTTSYILPGLNHVQDQRTVFRSKGSAIQRPSLDLPHAEAQGSRGANSTEQ